MQKSILIIYLHSHTKNLKYIDILYGAYTIVYNTQGYPNEIECVSFYQVLRVEILLSSISFK